MVATAVDGKVQLKGAIKLGIDTEGERWGMGITMEIILFGWVGKIHRKRREQNGKVDERDVKKIPKDRDGKPVLIRVRCTPLILNTCT